MLCKSEQVSGEMLRYVFSALVLITDKHRPQRLEMNVEWELICAFIHYVTMRIHISFSGLHKTVGRSIEEIHWCCVSMYLIMFFFFLQFYVYISGVQWCFKMRRRSPQIELYTVYQM